MHALHHYKQQSMLQSMLHANTLNCKASIRAHIYAHTRARPLAPCRAASEPTPPPAEAPSRGVLILPGLGNNAGDYGQLADALRSRGLAVEVAQVCARPVPPVPRCCSRDRQHLQCTCAASAGHVLGWKVVRQCL